jgi:hypothetical protein
MTDDEARRALTRMAMNVYAGSSHPTAVVPLEAALAWLDARPAQPAPEAGEREALIVDGRREAAEDRRIAPMFRQQKNRDAMIRRAEVTERLCDALARRSQPAPRTVTAEEVLRASDDFTLRAAADDAGCPSVWMIRTVLAALGITVEPTP